MAARTFGRGRFRGFIRIRQGMMPECEEAPVIGPRKALTVFYCCVDAVVLTVEIPAAGRFLTRAVWKLRRIKDSRQLLYDERSFWKLARLQVCIDVFLLNVHEMVFGKVSLSIVEGIRR